MAPPGATKETAEPTQGLRAGGVSNYNFEETKHLFDIMNGTKLLIYMESIGLEEVWLPSEDPTRPSIASLTLLVVETYHRM